MKRLLLSLFLIPALCFSQQKKGYASAAVAFDFPSDIGQGIGASLTGNGQITDGLYLGLGIGVTKFQNLSKPLIPICANITIVPGDENKVHPIIFLQPGYGVYNNTTRFVNTKGGFFFNIDAGIGFPGKKVNPFLVAGYSDYRFTTNNNSSECGGLAIRAGFRFK